jgi:hypothetical protein
MLSSHAVPFPDPRGALGRIGAVLKGRRAEIRTLDRCSGKSSVAGEEPP